MTFKFKAIFNDVTYTDFFGRIFEKWVVEPKLTMITDDFFVESVKSDSHFFLVGLLTSIFRSSLRL